MLNFTYLGENVELERWLKIQILHEIPVLGVRGVFEEDNPVWKCWGCSSFMPWVEMIFASAVVLISVEINKSASEEYERDACMHVPIHSHSKNEIWHTLWISLSLCVRDHVVLGLNFFAACGGEVGGAKWGNRKREE